MTIVCATRFSEESSFAGQVAAELARKSQQPLWLVHVLPGRLVRAWSERFEATATAALETQAQALRQPGLEVHTAVLTGKLDQAVGRFCTVKSASLLVVGDTTRNMSTPMTGTLDRLAYGVETPLLVVRDPRPFQSWAAGKAPLKVMLAIDRTSSSAIARDWISRLAQFGDLDLVATHIWWPSEEYERRALPTPAAEEGHRALTRTMEEETAATLAGLPKNVKVRVHLQMGVQEIGAHLLALANEEQVDIFVLGTHRRRALGRLWSVSHHVLSLAPMSVACIPSTVAVADVGTVQAFHTALAATNFSEAGNRAVTCALAIVGAGTVHVVHVSTEPFSADGEKALLKKLISVLPPDSEKNARVLVHVLHGKVAEELIKVTERLSVDVVCLGSRAETVLNSAVISEVLQRAGRPVLFATPVKA